MVRRGDLDGPSMAGGSRVALTAGGARRGRRRGVVAKRVRAEIARDLHDSVAQSLVGLLIEIEEFKVLHADRKSVHAHLTNVQAITREVLGQLRFMVSDLRGEDFETVAFADEVRMTVAKFEERSGIRAALITADWPERLPIHVGRQLHHVIGEALSNVRLHSRASSVRVELAATPDWLVVSIRDDGVGMPPPPWQRLGMGIPNLQERAALLGGTVAISAIEGSGSQVLLEIPRVVPVPEPTGS